MEINKYTKYQSNNPISHKRSVCLRSLEDRARSAMKIKFGQKIRKSTILFKIMATQQDSLRKSEEA